MNQSELANFDQILINCNSEDDNIRNQATQVLLNLRDQNIFNFLSILLAVIQNQSCSPLSKRLSLILAAQTFQKIEVPDPTIQRYQFIENNCPGLLSQYLSASSSFFPVIANLSAYLFSVVTEIIGEYNEQSDILPSLLQQIESITDYSFLEGAFRAIEYISLDFVLNPEYYQPILIKIFVFIGNPEVPEQIKSILLSILSNFISFISDVFQNKQNVETIINVLKYSLSEYKTKESGYKCLTKLIKYHFPIFAMIANEVIESSIGDLNQNSDDEQIILSILQMIQKLTKKYQNDEYYESKKEILIKSFPLYFGLLIKIALDHDDNPVESDTYNASVASYQLIGDIISSIPDVAFQPYLEFAQANIQSPEPKMREMSLALFAYITNIPQAIELIPNILQLFPGILNDPHPRVQDLALYVLQQIISNYYTNYQQIINSLSQPLLVMLNKELSNPHISSSICTTISKIDNLPNYKDVLLMMLQLSNTPSPIFADHLFFAIEQILDKTKNFNILEQMLPHFIEVVKLGILNPEYHQNQVRIFYVFEKLCLKAKELLFPFIPELHPLFVQCYIQTQEHVAIECLVNLAISTGKAYLPYLEQLMELHLQLFGRSDDHVVMDSLSSSLMLLNDYFELQLYTQRFSEIILNLLEIHKNNLRLYSQFLPVLTSFFAKYIDVLGPAVLLTVRFVSEIVLLLENVVDDYERQNFIESATNLMNILFENEQDSFQWFELGIRILDAASKFIDIEVFEENDNDDDDNNYDDFAIYASLFANLFTLNGQFLNQFIINNQETQVFFNTLMSYSKCKDIITQALVNVPLNTEEN